MNRCRALFHRDWTIPRRTLITGLCVAAILSVFPSASADEHAANPVVLELKIDGEVEPILATYIAEGITDATNRHASLVLIAMDTPGGLSDSMKDIIQHILASQVPVAVYVYPTGARGASAGFFILLSADIAAMAPGTHTGAASPIIGVGGYPVAIDETLRRKITNDAQAFLRSFAESVAAIRSLPRPPSPTRRLSPKKRRSMASSSISSLILKTTCSASSMAVKSPASTVRRRSSRLQIRFAYHLNSRRARSFFRASSSLTSSSSF